MINICCPTWQHISRLQAIAWANHEGNVARELLKRLNEHEASCAVCEAVRNGTGLAGGLFEGAKIGQEVKA